ncbi:CRP/FNR family transcriptional regulator, cyclic AMP receptor protein [Gammaproteobacteria bacterium]
MFQKISLFAGLTEDNLTTLRAHAVPKHYPRHTVVLSQGDETDSLYIIETGRVKVYVNDEDGREFILGTMTEGDYFGELALFDKGPRSASVMTLEPCRFWVIARHDFLGWAIARPEILMNLIQALVRRIRGLNEDIASLALLDVYGRVARVLLQRAVEVDQKQVIDRLTHQEIASMVGASREMVSRILKDLKQGGYIETDGKRIVIKDRLPHNW